MSYLKLGVCLLLPFLAVMSLPDEEPAEYAREVRQPSGKETFPIQLTGAFTGGFGEESCHSCHFDHPLNDGEAALRLRGLPENYQPGQSYPVTVSLRREGLARGGFQLSARRPDSTQAGRFTLDSPRLQFTKDLENVRYVQHTEEGTRPGEEGTIRWKLEWTAPDAESTVIFHLAANAGNGDESSFGDHIYTLTRRIPPAGK